MGLFNSCIFKGRIFKDSDDKIAEKRMEKIAQAINDNDQNIIKQLFAKQIVNLELDENAQELIDIFSNGINDTWEISYGLYAEKSVDNGVVIKTMEWGYTVCDSNTQEQYLFLMIECLENTENSNAVGMQLLLLCKIKERDSWGEWWKSLDVSQRPTGIYLYST